MVPKQASAAALCCLLYAKARTHLNSISQAGTRVAIVHTAKSNTHSLDCCLLMLSHRLQPEYAYRGISVYLAAGCLAKKFFQM